MVGEDSHSFFSKGFHSDGIVNAMLISPFFSNEPAAEKPSLSVRRRSQKPAGNADDRPGKTLS
jgi:hypothetical protein